MTATLNSMHDINSITWCLESPFHKRIEPLFVGLKMVCLDDSFSDQQTARCNALPVVGHIYSVRAVRIAWRNTDVALMFEEIVNPKGMYEKEPAFRLNRFEQCESWLMRIENDDSANPITSLYAAWESKIALCLVGFDARESQPVLTPEFYAGLREVAPNR